MNNEDTEIKNLIGKPYWENKHLLKYGGTVDSHGIIVQAYTKDEVKRCSNRICHNCLSTEEQILLNNYIVENRELLKELAKR